MVVYNFSQGMFNNLERYQKATDKKINNTLTHHFSNNLTVYHTILFFKYSIHPV